MLLRSRLLNSTWLLFTFYFSFPGCFNTQSALPVTTSCTCSCLSYSCLIWKQ